MQLTFCLNVFMSILLSVLQTTDVFLGDMDLNLDYFVFVIQGFCICGKYIVAIFQGCIFSELLSPASIGVGAKDGDATASKTCDHPN